MNIQTVNTWGKSHGLSAETVRRMKLRRVTQAVATRLLGFPAPIGAVLIPALGPSPDRRCQNAARLQMVLRHWRGRDTQQTFGAFQNRAMPARQN